MKKDEEKKEKQKRTPVVCVMGHIDHGKSSLLDFIRKTNLTEKEKGGITQHIGAYEFSHIDDKGEKRQITFIDTPGHEAFAGTRRRGVSSADIGIVVVSAEDGVMPQTKEAFKCAIESKTPFIVAISKIDKPNADIEKTKQSLAENEIYVEGYGGDIPVVPISSKTGEGVPELLEIIHLIADMEDLSGDSRKDGTGIVIESKIDKQKGSTATVIVKDGSIKIGDFVVAEDAFAPVRVVENWQGEKKNSAEMGEPAFIIGWNKPPRIGAIFHVVHNKKDAEVETKDFAEKNKKKILKAENSEEENKKVIIPIILKGDAMGSIEAMKHEIEKIRVNNVEIKIIGEGVGNISETDIKLASGFKGALVLGFNTKIDTQGKTLAERDKVEARTFDIIYDLTIWLKEIAENRRPKELVEKITSKLKILKIFQKEKDKQVVGGKVLEGEIKLGDEVRIVRRENEIGKGKIRELQKQKMKVESVSIGTECGMLVQAEKIIAEGDILESFIKEEI